MTITLIPAVEGGGFTAVALTEAGMEAEMEALGGGTLVAGEPPNEAVRRYDWLL